MVSLAMAEKFLMCDFNVEWQFLTDVSRNVSVRNYHSALRNVQEECRSQILVYLMATFHTISRQFIFLFPGFVVSSFKLYFITSLCKDLGDLFTTITCNEAPFTIYCNKHTYVCNEVGRDSSVSIAIRCGLDGPGIESRWGRDFPHPSIPALWPTQPPIQWVPGLSRG
jgi:hypothetical protein